jgi:hypothetical protein
MASNLICARAWGWLPRPRPCAALSAAKAVTASAMKTAEKRRM